MEGGGVLPRYPRLESGESTGYITGYITGNSALSNVGEAER